MRHGRSEETRVRFDGGNERRGETYTSLRQNQSDIESFTVRSMPSGLAERLDAQRRRSVSISSSVADSSVTSPAAELVRTWSGLRLPAIAPVTPS